MELTRPQARRSDARRPIWLPGALLCAANVAMVAAAFRLAALNGYPLGGLLFEGFGLGGAKAYGFIGLLGPDACGGAYGGALGVAVATMLMSKAADCFDLLDFAACGFYTRLSICV